MSSLPLFEDEQVKSLIGNLIIEHRTDELLLRKLCTLELDYAGSGRADGYDADIAEALDMCLRRRGEK